MTEAQRAVSPKIDYRPFIIADADTGHGGDAHVRNLIRRFVEAGVPGYHIEDQKPGCKKCGHQGGKVLVPVDEQIKRLNAARFQLDIMRVPGIIVARTDAEAATLLDGKGDERDQPFLLGVTNTNVPSWRVAYLSILRRFHELGMADVKGHLLYELAEPACEAAQQWLERKGVFSQIETLLHEHREDAMLSIDALVGEVTNRFVDLWQAEAGLETFGQAVADAMAFHMDEGREFDLTIEQWLDWSRGVGYEEASEMSRAMGLKVTWDCERARTPEGYFPVRGGIEYAIAKSLAVRPVLRSHLDGNQNRRLGGRPAVCRSDSRGLSGQDAGLQPLALIQLGHDGNDRRPDAGTFPRSWASWDSCSTSSPTAVTRSTAWRRRNLRPRYSRTGCSRWPVCSASCGWWSLPTRPRKRLSAARAWMAR